MMRANVSALITKKSQKIIDKKSFDGDRVRSLVTDQADFVLLDSQKRDLFGMDTVGSFSKGKVSESKKHFTRVILKRH